MSYVVPDVNLDPPDEPEIPDRILEQAERELFDENLDNMRADLKAQFRNGYFADEIQERAERILSDLRESADEAKAEAREDARSRLDGTGGP